MKKLFLTTILIASLISCSNDNNDIQCKWEVINVQENVNLSGTIYKITTIKNTCTGEIKQQYN